MSFDSFRVTNIFLACIAFVNLAILALLYQFAKKGS
jgi:hypothetical protein